MRLLAAFAFGVVIACGAAFAKEIPIDIEQPPICRPENFQGCCSYNEGLEDQRTGKCRNGATSPTCSDRWTTSLQGRCSWNGGVASVDANGVVYCNNEKSPGPAIPKCEAE